MKIWKQMVLFYLGGMCYSLLELLWRGFSHWSMFLLGGGCFVILGQLGQLRPALPLPFRAVAAAAVVTALELGCGLLVILAVLAARLLLRRVPKAVSYTLWLVVLFRLLCPVGFQSPVSLMPEIKPSIVGYISSLLKIVIKWYI